MKAWMTHGFNDMRLEEVPLPRARPGWAVVRVLVAQPSVTEVQLFRGERSSGFDIVVKRLEQGPALLFGHEFVGEVMEIDPADANLLKEGDRVSATHTSLGTIGRDFAGCFAEYVAVPVDALAAVPPDITDWAAAALQPLSSCVRNVKDIGITLGDVVVVLGQGVMGLNSAQVAKVAGADTVIGVDRRRELLALGEKLGIDAAIDASSAETVQAVLELTDGAGANIVIEAASGSPRVGLSGGSTISEAVECARAGGSILAVAHYHEPVPLDMNRLRKKRLAYLFPRALADHSDMALGARLIAQGRVQLEPMITHRLEGIEAIPEAIDITGAKAAHGAVNPAQVRISG